MGFYFRHFAGFLIQYGAGILLCLLPFGEAAFRFPRRKVVVANALLAVVSSVLFPVFIGWEGIASTPYQALAANLYMTAAILVFMVQYFLTLRVEKMKTLIVLVLVLFYAATQYLLVGIIESLYTNVRQGEWEVYLPIDLVLYTVTAVVMLPPMSLLMKHTVREYLAEIELESIRREFRLVLALTFLYFCILILYTAGPAGMIRKFWMWIIPPMVIAALLLTLFYWRLFRESIIRKREAEERRTLEIQKLQYETINHEMEQTRRMRHDLRHSLNYLSELFAKGEGEAVKAYLDELTTQISHRDTVTYCKNVTVNGLLQYYVGMAADQDIRCSVQASCGDISITPVDLTVLLGNMMENAIHACSQWGAIAGSV